MALYNLARMTTATTGTGATITLGSAVPGFLTFALAGVPNGATVSYGIIDGVNSETGTGTYTSSGTTLTRTVTKSTNADARISLSGSAHVSITARAEDLNLGNYLPLAGGTLTGDLSIDKTNSGIFLNKTASGQQCYLVGSKGAFLSRWDLQLGDIAPESTGNAGSNFIITRYDDAGSVINTPLTITRSTGVVTVNSASLTGVPVAPTAATATNTTQIATTAFVKAQGYKTQTDLDAYLPTSGAAPMTGRLQFLMSNPFIELQKSGSGEASYIVSRNVANTRWLLNLGNVTPELGSNSGSDFVLARYDDGGTSIGNISITRSDGQISSTGDLEIKKPTAPTIALNKTVATVANGIYGQTNGVNRWNILLGHGLAEGGGDAGSNFFIQRFTDGGSATTCISIVRSTGVVTIADANLTGSPTTVTAATADNSTAVASTAYVKAQAYATLASPALSGTPTAPTASVGTTTTQIATTAFVDAEAVAKAGDTMTGLLTASGGLTTGTNEFTVSNTGQTGIGTASPTASWVKLGASTTAIAHLNLTSGVAPTTPVDGDIWRQDNTTTGLKYRVGGVTQSFTYDTDLVIYAPLASPALTGTPTAPTASVGTTTTQLATTAFVDAEAVAKAGDTMTGNLVVSTTNPFIFLHRTSTAAGSSQIQTYAGTTTAAANLRWSILTGFNNEGGSDTGSDFAIRRFSDSGVNLGNAILVTRSTGVMALANADLGSTGVATTPATSDSSTKVATTAYVKSNLTPQVDTLVTLTYSASISTNAALGNRFIITATNGTAFTINAPTNPSTGQQLTYTIKNTSGGALGTITWNAVFKKPAFVTAATANNRSISFFYDGTNWIMLAAGTTDVPN